MITIWINTDSVRSQLAQLASLARHPRPVLKAATGAVRKTLQEHFRERDKTSNKLGGKRTHFWMDVYNSTQIGEVTDTRGTVIIWEPRFAQKVYGGTITAGKGTSSATGRPTKYLAIPARSEAYGRRPSALKGIEMHVVQCGPMGGAALVVKTASKTKSSFLDLVMYWLVRKVTQKKDPEALPSSQVMQDAAVRSAESYIRARFGAAGRP